MSPIGMIFRIVKTAAQTKGQSLEMEWELLPQTDGAPIHIHPQASESYRVLQGQVEINIDGQWHWLHQGEELTVPAGIPHTFRNPTENVSKVYNVHSPAMNFEGYFSDLHHIVDKLSGQGQEKLRLNLKTVTYLAMLMKKYPKEIISVNPPNFIVSLLNMLGKARRLEV
ncbi:cupin domain-containing protein [Pontibacter sp. H259]|uniref:cupin domain-containing protein n=1 Tax=Pontibacter sp. H259 TaxID=3133421 RepID=UPI0030C567A4